MKAPGVPLLLLFFLLSSSLSFADPLPAEESWFTPTEGSTEPRSVFWRPMLSLLLPGLDQYRSGHDTSAAIYGSVWLGAQVWSVNRLRRLKDDQDDMHWKDWSRDQKDDYSNHEELPRQATLASQYITAVGGLSAWHSFRTSVTTQRPTGRFEFLPAKDEETPMDLLRAPFHFEFLQRKTTWIPMLIAAGVGALSTSAFDDEIYQKDPYSSSDAFYASALSYNAGVSEEALFRGFLQPVMTDVWHSPFWANSTQALIFGLAHLGTVNRPLPQVGMGYYLGWLQQKNNWTLSEGIFVHAWWDVIALSSSYLVRLKSEKRGPPPVLWLPPFTVMW